jgi:glycosyltransferase involved in cell wall biosynthesis
MALFIRLAGNDATHVLLSKTMENAFKRAYPFEVRTRVVLNAGLIGKADATPARMSGPLVLGHLSRLGPKKGLQDVLSTFEVMAKTGMVRLILAGPPEDKDSQRRIKALEASYPDLVEWWGPVSGARKEEFYNSIDVFLFPVRQDEAQPLVLLESMQHGRPCIAYAREVISEMLVDSGGVVVDQAEDFADSSLQILLHWVENRASFASAAASARHHFDVLLRASIAQRNDLIDLIVGS